jgi:hypothetical protein
MAFTQMIDVGSPTLIAQNQVVALPTSRCLVFTSDAAPTIVASNDPAFSNNAPITLTNGQFETAAPFIKCTSANITITAKKF